jgi:hypothetical protein
MLFGILKDLNDLSFQVHVSQNLMSRLGVPNLYLDFASLYGFE